MAPLIKLSEVAEWIADIHQRPPGEPLTGGPPDLSNDAGFANVQAQQLASRTSFLYGLLGGDGEASTSVTDLNALTRPNLYHYSAGAAGAPSVLEGFVHHARSVSGAGMQEATDSSGLRWVRSRPTSGNWTDWKNVWDSGSVSITDGTFSTIKVPGGKEIKTGVVSVTSDRQIVPFPVAFDNNCDAVVLCDVTVSSGGVSNVATYGIETDTLTRNNFRVRSSASGGISYIAVGH